MYQITKWKTSDDEEFDSLEDAKKYLDEDYGKELISLARELCVIEKYEQMIKYLDDNIGSFRRLIALKMEIENPIFLNEEDY